MDIYDDTLKKIFTEALETIQDHRVEKAGRVISFADDICKVEGLSSIAYGEHVIFDGGNEGVVFDIEQDICCVAVLHDNAISTHEGVFATGKLFSVTTSAALLGRVIDILGKPLDGLPLVHDDNYEIRVSEAQVKGIIERKQVNTPLYTGILTIDTLVPIGKGQRQLLVGNRSTGKTSAAINAIINQKNKNVICIYVAIAQRRAHVARLIDNLEQNGALDYTIIIVADAAQKALHHYLAPYVGSSVAEYFSDQGKDVLIVYDDLSNHATAYREISLLMQRSPGREAYPGDIFYLHSRLLERAGSFINGGSITALPIAQIQEDDITAYIPTNLISITDGQLFFDTALFNTGIKPAINTELSVSRVGGSAQPKIINKLSRALRLDLAQYHELSAFSQFGADLDEVSSQKIKKGKLLVELLKQSIDTFYSVSDEAIILYLFRNHEQKLIKYADVKHYVSWVLSFIKHTESVLYQKIGNSSYDEAIIKELEECIQKTFEIYSSMMV